MRRWLKYVHTAVREMLQELLSVRTYIAANINKNAWFFRKKQATSGDLISNSSSAPTFSLLHRKTPFQICQLTLRKEREKQIN